jgi:hypothetical protein
MVVYQKKKKKKRKRKTSSLEHLDSKSHEKESTSHRNLGRDEAAVETVATARGLDGTEDDKGEEEEGEHPAQTRFVKRNSHTHPFNGLTIQPRQGPTSRSRDGRRTLRNR